MHNHHEHHNDKQPSLNRLAFSATAHCMTGCSIGEVSGMVLGSWLIWDNHTTIIVSIALAFVFGYSLTLMPLLKSGLSWKQSLPIAFASDTASITIMEIVDNLIMLVIPGAMTAGLASFTFWGSLVVAIILGGAAAFPVNRWLIKRGRGHALVHKHH